MVLPFRKFFPCHCFQTDVGSEVNAYRHGKVGSTIDLFVSGGGLSAL